ncbi:cytidine deaminase-like protein [Panaeolus papilionaceus]|nr:cytidine deaminase-like protein [Panaeolus papilionaceus]
MQADYGAIDFSLNRRDPRPATKHFSFLSLSPLASPATFTAPPPPKYLCFSDTKDLLDYVTRNWQQNFVTTDLQNRDMVTTFVRRPFFYLLASDAPLFAPLSLESFVAEHDKQTFGTAHDQRQDCLQDFQDLIDAHVVNDFPSVEHLHQHLDRMDILHPEHLRPSWDSYFMTMASLASRRSNCMKRRVGAILVRENRVLATGYNGTPRGLKNCNEGGCLHCNGSSALASSKSGECLCLHAEENALLEAGRERVGKDCVLYCNTCPCLKCTVKIIQTGVKTVVYNLTYKVDDASATLFKEAGVELRRHDPNNSLRIPPSADEGTTSPSPTSTPFS